MSTQNNPVDPNTFTSFDNIDLYDYHKHNLVYITDHIKFADAKAGIGLGATLVMISFLGKKAKEIGFNEISNWEILLLIGLIPLVISCFFFTYKVLWPQYPKGISFYMSWGGIASFSDSSYYVTTLKNKTREEFIDNMAEQNHDLSTVCAQKYNNLKWAFTFFVIGAVIETVSWFIM